MTTRSGKRIHNSYSDDSLFDAIALPIKSTRSKRQRENACTRRQKASDCSADACPGPDTNPEANTVQPVCTTRETLKDINGQLQTHGPKKQTYPKEIVTTKTVIKNRDKKKRTKNDGKQQNICDTVTNENGDHNTTNHSKTDSELDKVKPSISLSESFHTATDSPNSEADSALLFIPKNPSNNANMQLNVTFDCDSGSSLRSLDATYEVHSADETVHEGKHSQKTSAEVSLGEMENFILLSAGTSPVLLDDTLNKSLRRSGDQDVSETEARKPLIKEGTFTKECPQVQKSLPTITLGTALPLCKRKRSAEKRVSKSSPAADVQRPLPAGPRSHHKPSPAPGSPAPRRRLPDFAALHQRQFAAMESLQECQRRRALRAQRLLRPAVASPYPRPSSKPVTVGPQPKTAPVEASQPTANRAPSYTRFGFKLPSSMKPFSIGVSSAPSGPMPSLRGATWERHAQAMTRRLPRDGTAKPVALGPAPHPQERRVRSRTVLQGVRINRRFELQMKARNIPL